MLVNIIKKYIPINTKLWSPLCGDCTLGRIDKSENPDYFVLQYNDDEIALDHDGKYYADGELMVFPDKRVSSWRVLEFIYNNAKSSCLYEFHDCVGNIYTGRFDRIEDGKIYFYYFINSCGHITQNGKFEFSELVNMYEPPLPVVKTHINILNQNELHWDGYKLVSNKPELKPLQQVLARSTNNDPWRINLFSHMTYGDKYCCIGGIYTYCIPYEGNEHLLNKV